MSISHQFFQLLAYEDDVYLWTSEYHKVWTVYDFKSNLWNPDRIVKPFEAASGLDEIFVGQVKFNEAQAPVNRRFALQLQQQDSYFSGLT